MLTPWKRVTRLARTQLSLVTLDQLAASGMSSTMIKTAVKAGRLERMESGVYRIGGSTPTWEQDVLASVLAAGPGAVASHRAAARIWGLVDIQVIDVTVPTTRQPKLRRAVVHRSTDLETHHTTRSMKIPVTTPMRTLVDLGAVRPDLVADALERALICKVMSHLGAETMLEEVARRGRRGAGVLRRVLDERALGKDRPESLLEVRFARLLREYGLPAAAYQHRVRLPSRRHPVRVDFAYPELMLAIEVDGFRYHSTPEQLAADQARQAALEALGWRVLRFTWRRVVRQPARVARELATEIALASAAA